MARVYTIKTKRILSDGTEKFYTYQQTKYRPLSEKKILLSELKENEQFKEIIANKSLKKIEMFNKLYEITSKNERFKPLTKQQIKSLVYRSCQ